MTSSNQSHEASMSQVPPALDRPIEQVPPIELSQGQAIRERSDLEGIVEPAALVACQSLYDNNIKTVSASANSKDTERAYIVVDYLSLSDKNKTVAEQIGELVSSQRDETSYGVKISVPLTSGETEADVSLKLSTACEPFAKQELTWAQTYDLAQLKAIYGYTEADIAHPEDFIDQGFYYDEATKTFHESHELYQMSLWKQSSEEEQTTGPSIEFQPEHIAFLEDFNRNLQQIYSAPMTEYERNGQVYRLLQSSADHVMALSAKEENADGITMAFFAEALGAAPDPGMATAAIDQLVKSPLLTDYEVGQLHQMSSTGWRLRQSQMQDNRVAQEMHDSAADTYANVKNKDPSRLAPLQIALLAFGAGATLPDRDFHTATLRQLLSAVQK